MDLFKRLSKVLIIFIVLTPVPIVFASIYFNTENVIYRASSGGIIFLEQPYYATQTTFSDGFLMFSNFNYGSGTWGSIGFSCLTEAANMTVNAVKSNYLKYTVDAPTSTTSITKIYLGSKGRPTSVVGAESWDYNSFNKTITISVIHSSPQEIDFEWDAVDLSKEWMKTVLFPTLSFASIILVVMAGAVMMNALSGNVDPEMIKNIITVAIVLTLAIIIGVRFL